MEPTMYFVVNDTLKMGKGKVASQVAHACLEVYRNHFPAPIFDRWKRLGQAKVVLRADQATVLSLAKTYADRSYLIRDAGRTQIEAGSPTVLGFEVMDKNSNSDLAKLKLL
jgi:peptidyl-tRNA hydrolase, PTH2 family